MAFTTQPMSLAENSEQGFSTFVDDLVLSSSPGKWSGDDNGWALSLLEPVVIEFDKSIMKYPSIKRSPGGASNDLIPNLQNPADPLPLLKYAIERVKVRGGG